MLEKLAQIEKNYEELTAQISSPEIMSDMSSYAKTMKQHRSLEEIVEKYRAVKKMNEDLTGARQRSELKNETRVVLLSPQGRVFDQKLAAELSEAEQIVLICGRYEGVDERVAERLTTDEISIGDYVLSGGEAAAAILVDAIVRLVPGALGSETSAINESFSEGLLDYPHYTRPPDFRGSRVPDILLGGNHAEVAQWRCRAALRKTKRNRPDLLERIVLSETEKVWLDEEGIGDES